VPPPPSSRSGASAQVSAACETEQSADGGASRCEALGSPPRHTTRDWPYAAQQSVDMAAEPPVAAPPPREKGCALPTTCRVRISAATSGGYSART